MTPVTNIFQGEKSHPFGKTAALYQAARMLTHGGFPTHQKSDSMVVYLGGREHGCGD